MLFRRQFLACAAAGVVPARSLFSAEPRLAPRCLLLAEPSNPLAAESLRGYQRFLAQRSFPFSLSDQLGVETRALLVPGWRTLPQSTAASLQRLIHDGAWALLETGLGFAAPHDIAWQKSYLERELGIRIEAPAAARKSAPYLHYHWPCDALVRHFTEVVPIDPGCGQSIATAPGASIAIRRPIGRGGVIYLGSPLGPILNGGDTQAEQLVQAMLSAMQAG